MRKAYALAWRYVWSLPLWLALVPLGFVLQWLTRKRPLP